MEAGTSRRPALHRLPSARSGIVQDEGNVLLFRNVILDGVAELAEPTAATALLILADNPSSPGVQRGQQSGPATPHGAGVAAFDLPRP